MKGSTFRHIYEEAGLTQQQLCDLLSHGDSVTVDSTIRRWIRNGPPISVAILMHLLGSGHITIEQIRRAR